jgi:hypothetical protein
MLDEIAFRISKKTIKMYQVASQVSTLRTVKTSTKLCALDLPQGAMLLASLHVQQLRDGCVIPQVLPRVAHVRAHQQRPTLQLAADPAAVGTAAPLELVVETSAHHLEGCGWIPVLDGSFCLVSNRSFVTKSAGVNPYNWAKGCY